MPEQQNIEWKSGWHDDYLEWICGFANAQGGQIYIGKSDDGRIVGVSDTARLMELIPNKIKNYLGINCDVNLHNEQGKYYIEIVVPTYTVPISLRGRYYYRNGSVKSELTGASLNEFLLKKTGTNWDEVVEPQAKWSDIDEASVQMYLKEAEKIGRLPEHKNLSTKELFEKLRLTKQGHLKRAAIILFGKDPVNFYPNTFVKIGRFTDDTTLTFQEVEEGNLISLLPAVISQLQHKFLIREVSFEGLYRRETEEYPADAMREMILNALVHRTYMGAPTQIRVYDRKINIWNEGMLPDGLTFASLKEVHSSIPRNPVIADVCFKGGLIEAWGRGTIKIIESCKNANLPEPEIAARNGGVSVTLFRKKNIAVGSPLNKIQQKVLEYIEDNGAISNQEYQDLFNVSKSTATRELSKLVQMGFLLKEGTTGKGTLYRRRKNSII